MTNPIKPVTSYLRESKEELKKVTWPSRRETVRYSIIVIVVSLATGALFAGLDWALNLGLEQLIILTS
ncbi:preprotein translocase subunit SecE [Candidatus Uhrbacteria bacterium RIFOXYB12_FULL_58_10]|uniref:Protein translocase subunit SecE n=1 Tax=Candidatus Uhrbacteria bacterium RIFOXYB2_FULL_57_15 TaxID=1802422 RepID=A0A1F7W7U6_9BACT|nr:MAG: preprotein translocase subunit SecE [Candidatus Uhrbacteria bacterium RIFOXYB12_FULL_58_10]OGL98885.1 MAG: preprotein translocase subunit SecE [Candidatus Uhrbacteria bacterium RIFOXYB2_FULL_57_15]OGM00342.1 MAG: preprotein translocase subunit SecE [Candidatus Uhrbacteria bacterium RIFOXYC12_FULL_57_11]